MLRLQPDTKRHARFHLLCEREGFVLRSSTIDAIRREIRRRALESADMAVECMLADASRAH